MSSRDETGERSNRRESIPDAPAGDSTERRPVPPYPTNLGHPYLHFIRLQQGLFEFNEKVLRNGDVVRIKLPGFGDITCLGHPDYLKQVLLTEREKFQKVEANRIAFGDGLLTVGGEKWRKQNDLLQPFFSLASIRSYAEEMPDLITRRVGRWEDGDTIELQAEMSRLTIEVLFGTLFGRQLDLDGDETIRKAAENLNEWFKPTSYPLPSWIPTPARWRFKQARQTIREEADRLLEEKADNASTVPAEADDLLSLLVGLRDSEEVDAAMTDDEIQSQVVTMILAGYDTTTSALTFTFYEIATNPEVRERFKTEVDVLDDEPAIDDLDQLEFPEQIIKESMRMHPPVHNIARSPTTDVTFGDYRVPESETVWLRVRDVHRDSRFYDDPATFRPDRWSGGFESELHNFAYVPFGGGPRTCIGRQFAMVEMQLALAKIGRQFELEWLGDDTSEPPTDPQLTNRLAPGSEFRVHER